MSEILVDFNLFILFKPSDEFMQGSCDDSMQGSGCVDVPEDDKEIHLEEVTNYKGINFSDITDHTVQLHTSFAVTSCN